MIVAQREGFSTGDPWPAQMVKVCQNIALAVDEVMKGASESERNEA